MNKQTAQQKGLQYTGTYERNPEDLKPRLEEIRKAGYKAYIVTIPVDRYSRSASRAPGYSIYTEPQYQIDNTANELRARIANHSARLLSIRVDFEKQNGSGARKAKPRQR